MNLNLKIEIESTVPICKEMWIDVIDKITHWEAAFSSTLPSTGFDIFRRYPSRQSAIRNAALWGRDMLAARGTGKHTRNHPSLINKINIFLKSNGH